VCHCYYFGGSTSQLCISIFGRDLEITMYDMTNICTTLGCASGSGILVLFLVPSLQVFYLTMLLAEHRGLITNDYGSISGNEAVFTLCIDE